MITAITPVCNRSDLTHQFLMQNWQRYGTVNEPDIRWIVIDNGSTDNTPGLLKIWQSKMNGHLVTVRNKKNQGFGRANNQAFAEHEKHMAADDVVLFINNDVLVRGDYLSMIIMALAAVSICELGPVAMWLPFMSGSVEVDPLIYVPLATVLLWISINATNCADGVDGLSGSLLLLAFLYMGAILYGAVGHRDVAEYLHLPHYPMGADWAVMAITLAGALAGYLWHNAKPSRVLMGDAGSRALGLLLGVFVLASGNPFLILVVAAVVLVNGGTGLVKVALLRFFKIGIFRNVRFPLHDHCRKQWGWSDSQVLMRFILLQAVLTPLLIVLLFRVL